MRDNRDDRPPLSEGQVEIMNVVWEQGSATVAEVRSALSVRRSVARNTVQTMMTRLEEKNWLVHEREGKTFRYRAAMPRAKAMSQMVSRLVATAFAGSAEDLVAALLSGRGVSGAEARRIQALIDDAESGPGLGGRAVRVGRPHGHGSRLLGLRAGGLRGTRHRSPA